MTFGPFVPKDWQDSPSVTTPITAGALEDIETRVTDYTDDLAAVSMPVINVNEGIYNVVPGVTASPEVLIQAAIDQANTNAIAGSGPTIVYVGPGTYTINSWRLIPGQSGTVIAAAALWLYDNVWLQFAPGAVLKVPNNATTLPSTATRAHVITTYRPYLRPWAGGAIKKNVRIIGGEIDCNATNQTYVANSDNGLAPVVGSAIMLGFCERSAVVGTKVKNLFGNAPGPNGESFHFETWVCNDVEFIDCEADGSGSPNTATGFSAGNSFGVSYMSCRAHGMGYGNGFTNYQSANVTHSDCHAYDNGFAGYNTELGDTILYSACIAGGVTPDVNTNAEPPWWESGTGLGSQGQETIGNVYGWAIQGGRNIQLDASCQSRYNTSYGVRAYTNVSITPNEVVAGAFIHGMHLDNGSTDADNVLIDSGQTNVYAQVKMRSNTDYGSTQYAEAPIEEFKARNTTSGMRFYVDGNSSFAWRWFRNGQTVADLAVNGNAQVSTRGRTHARTATAVNYIQLHSDEYIGVTSTASARTITLQTAANAGAGTSVTVKDESGLAGTNNITVIVAGPGNIEGGASKVITTNYGVLRLLSTGTEWVLV